MARRRLTIGHLMIAAAVVAVAGALWRVAPVVSWLVGFLVVACFSAASGMLLSRRWHAYSSLVLALVPWSVVVAMYLGQDATGGPRISIYYEDFFIQALSRPWGDLLNLVLRIGYLTSLGVLLLVAPWFVLGTAIRSMADEPLSERAGCLPVIVAVASWIVAVVVILWM